MKTWKLTLLLVGLLTANVHRSVAGPLMVNVEAIVFSLPKAQAALFLAQHHLDAAAGDGYNDLQKLLQQRKAQSVANVAVTTKSGQKAESGNVLAKLEVEPVIGPDNVLVDLNAQLDFAGNKITTSFALKNGHVRFVGSFNSLESGRDITYLIFFRVLVGE